MHKHSHPGLAGRGRLQLPESDTDFSIRCWAGLGCAAGLSSLADRLVGRFLAWRCFLPGLGATIGECLRGVIYYCWSNLCRAEGANQHWTKREAEPELRHVFGPLGG
jgi:hypothetical protein